MLSGHFFLFIHSSSIEDPQEIANEFNNHFISYLQNINESIEEPFYE